MAFIICYFILFLFVKNCGKLCDVEKILWPVFLFSITSFEKGFKILCYYEIKIFMQKQGFY